MAFAPHFVHTARHPHPEVVWSEIVDDYAADLAVAASVVGIQELVLHAAGQNG